MKKIRWLILSGLACLLLALGIWTVVKSETNNEPIDPAKRVVVYKSPTCGCCGNYIKYLEDAGYHVDTVKIDDMSEIKQKYGIPENMESCHTAIFGDYVVEGHIPLEVVEKMLVDKPDIKGIALPDMPAGSPGMPGTKVEPFTIYSLTATGTEIFGEY